MKYIEVIAEQGSADTISAIAEKVNASDIRFGIVDDNGMQSMRLLVSDDKVQDTLDKLQHILGAQSYAKIIVLPVEIALPRPEAEKEKEEKKATATRELLYNEIERSAQLNWNYVVLVVLSTIVAAIGLIENNVAVVVGAMVIAPLLGPNLAFSLGTALGDTDLMKKSGLTTAVGILLAIALSLLLGLFWPIETSSHELIARTDIGWDSIFLALASGAAASISLTTGLPSVLVGVMVAVALLPPAATFGIFLGKGNIDLAIGAGLLLAINVVCVNLSSKIVFLFKGVRPRTWLEKAKAKRSMLVFVLMWLVTLLILVVSIYARQELDLH
jgi:uncharacterized hydrophobic protein (TIGR00341 family)